MEDYALRWGNYRRPNFSVFKGFGALGGAAPVFDGKGPFGPDAERDTGPADPLPQQYAGRFFETHRLTNDTGSVIRPATAPAVDPQGPARRLDLAYGHPAGYLAPVEVVISPANYGLRAQARRMVFMSQYAIHQPGMINVGGRHLSPPWNRWAPYPARQHTTEIAIPSGVVAITPAANLNPLSPASLG